MFGYNLTQHILFGQVPLTVFIAVIWVLAAVLAFSAFFFHNKSESTSMLTSLSYFNKFVAIFGIKNTKASQSAASQSSTSNKGLGMISDWLSATPDSNTTDEESKKAALPTNFTSKRFTKNASSKKEEFQSDLVLLRTDAIQERLRKKVLPSFTILNKKLREIKRNIRENGGQLDFSDVNPMSPIKKSNGLERIISIRRKSSGYETLDSVMESSEE